MKPELVVAPVTSGAHLPILTAAEMQAVDRAATTDGTPIDTLMERAGAGAAEVLERRFGSLRGFRVRAVCGKGNNGGDGFVAARHLARRGARVEALLVGEADALTGAARANWERLADTGAVRTALGSDARTLEVRLAERLRGPNGADVVIDALLGTGAKGRLAPAFAAAVRAIAACEARVVALDLPTGIDADTGRPGHPSDPVVQASLTIAFACLKPAHVLFPGRSYAGAIEVVDIGLEPDPTSNPPLLALPSELARLLPRRTPVAHKGDAGRVLVVGGSVGLTGAVVLASMSALRAGAGLVTAAVPESVNGSIEAAMIEAMTWPLPESAERALAEESAAAILERSRGVEVVALGPGLSRAPGASALARRLVAELDVPMVLDADGLNAFVGDPDALRADRRRAPLILTPHLGEMERLSGQRADELEAERLSAPSRYAKRWGAVVVLKGAPTVTADPDGRVTVNSTGNPALATGGTGDVLTGIIAGLVAQGVLPYDAARLGVFIHGLAGDLAETRTGTLSLVAGDVTAALPQALDRLERLAGSRSVPEPLPTRRFTPSLRTRSGVD